MSSYDKENLLDEQANGGGLLDSSSDEDRKGFIVKVYAILTTQLTVTFVPAILVAMNDNAREVLQDPDNVTAYVMVWVCMFVGLVVEIMILCCKNMSRKVPLNYFLLTIFTVCWAWMVTWISAQYDKTTVVTAAVYTLVITVALSLYACFTRADFTKLCGRWTCFALLIIITIQLMLSIVSMIIWEYTNTYVPLVAGFVVILYGLFLIIDT